MKTNGQKIILAGGSGFLGCHLAQHYRMLGWDVVVLTRMPEATARGDAGGVKHVGWDGKTVGDWAGELEGAKVLINLTGRNVNCRYTPANRRAIMESRLASTRVLGQALGQVRRRPRVWLQASSLAYYGDAGDHLCDEQAPAGSGFPVEVCRQWEETFAEVLPQDVRGVVLRIGFVLGRDGGALVPLENLTRWFLGGTIGNGNQWISWIHLADTIRAIDFLSNQEQASGLFNITGPEPVTNRIFMRQMRRVLHRPWSPPAPRWALHIGAWAMRTEAELALTGRRCPPTRLEQAGFTFDYPALAGALDHLYQIKGGWK